MTGEEMVKRVDEEIQTYYLCLNLKIIEKNSNLDRDFRSEV